MIESKSDIHDDFGIFVRALIESRDVDPTYPVVKHLIDLYDFEPEWFAFVYVSFYNLETAVTVAKEFPTKDSFSPDSFLKMREKGMKFGHERRGNSRKGDVIVDHLLVASDFISDIEAHKLGLTESPLLDSFSDFRRNLESIPNVGGWASFKIAEIFEKSLDYKTLEVDDLGLSGRNPNSNDGPVGGLRWLYGRDEVFDKSVFTHWDNFGKNLANAYGVNIGEIETCFCKFHKFVSGKYFIGHDIQEFVDLKHVMSYDDYYNMMYSNFDELFWLNHDKLQKDLKKHYKSKGEFVYCEDFLSKLPNVDVFDVLLNSK